jgi:hypothetical protein
MAPSTMCSAVARDESADGLNVQKQSLKQAIQAVAFFPASRLSLPGGQFRIGATV